MKNIRIPRVVTGFIAALFFLSASSAIAGVNIGGNIIWHDADDGAWITVLGPHEDLDIQAIIDAITDASETKPYLIKLGPGIYDIGATSITMKQYVSIQGSGVKATSIAGALGGDALSAIVHGADHVSLSDLTITNSGGSGGNTSNGIHNNDASPDIQRVAVNVSGGNENTGIRNYNSVPQITDVVVVSQGGLIAQGIVNNHSLHTDSQIIMTDVNVSVAGGSSENTGILNSHAHEVRMNRVVVAAQGDGTILGISIQTSYVVMKNVSASAFGGAIANHGVEVISSTVVMKDCEAVGGGATDSFGLHISKSDTGQAPRVNIQESSLVGSVSAKGLYIADTSQSHPARIVNNFIKGGVENKLTGSDKSKICRGNYDENLLDVTCK